MLREAAKRIQNPQVSADTKNAMTTTVTMVLPCTSADGNAIQSPAALCRGLMLPQFLQLGHCQWWARALKPQCWQR